MEAFMHTPEHIPILHEDNHLIIVQKPANMPSQEDDTGDLDMVRWLKEDLKLRYDKPGNVFVGLVHRLDRPVGGVMVFAKTSKAASRLSDEIRRRAFGKTYLAVVHGIPPEPEARLIHYLLKDNRTNTVTAFDSQQADTKEAILDYQALGHRDGFSLVRIDLHTGRPHQIRVQMAAIGCPLYGDQKYGQKVNKPGWQIALWSHRLSFSHPTLKTRLSFTSIPPQREPWNVFQSLIDRSEGR